LDEGGGGKRMETHQKKTDAEKVQSHKNGGNKGPNKMFLGSRGPGEKAVWEKKQKLNCRATRCGPGNCQVRPGRGGGEKGERASHEVIEGRLLRGTSRTGTKNSPSNDGGGKRERATEGNSWPGHMRVRNS